jgi:hypothetical protein
MLKRIFYSFCLIILTADFVHAGQIKVDISNNGRPLTEGLAAGYTAWSTNQNWFTGGDTTSYTFDGVTVTFKRVGSVGTALQPNYWKAGVQDATIDAKLTGDGIKVNTDGAGQIEMRLSGLSEGPHSLLTYHSVWDSIVVTNGPRLNVYLNSTQVITNLKHSVRVTNTLAAAYSYLNFNAVTNQDVTVLFEVNSTIPCGITNVYINGFEIDTPDLKYSANSPSPANGDEHVDADSKTVTLSWTPALIAVTNDIYVGTNSNSVQNATHASPEWKGGRTAANFLLTNVNSLLTYYWRVDEVDASGAVTKGALWMFRPRHLAFPGAEGYGRFARGGRGGVVVKVTNTNDSGPGSFRDAIVGDYGPRTVIFDVSGQIVLNDDVIISGSTPPITVAGQTAPGKGICFRRQQFAMSGARDAIVRHVRVRVGKESGETQNGSGMSGVDHSIMDHCSISWGIDEELSTRGGKNLTFQRCFISEALNVAGHQNYPAGTAHGYAASIGGDIASFHHNLLAHNEGRNWSLAGGLDGAGFFSGRLDIFNNVVYNWNGRTTDGGAHEVNFVNNYYKPGPAISQTKILIAQYDNFPGTQQYYFVGNVMPGYWQTNQQSSARSTSGFVPTNYPVWVTNAFFPSYATIDEVTNAYKKVVSDVGCNQPVIDDHDARVIRETIDKTYTYTGSVSGIAGLPDTTDDVGGWEDYGSAVRPANWDSDNDGMPNWWEVIKGFNPNSASGDFSESNSDLDGDGYTALEDYLNWVAMPHADCNVVSFVDIDLTALTRGFTNNSPRYAVFGAVNGTVITNGNGRTARFTPNVSTNALAGFTFSVVDANGYNMTNTIGVRVISVTANSAPVFSTSSSNRTINVGVNLNITNSATDADAGQVLTYSLPVKPTNASINTSSGVLSWRPIITQANSTNAFSVIVADNGSPSLSATQSFSVIVSPLSVPVITTPTLGAGQVGLSISGQVGPDYAVQGSSNLVNWNTILITNPTTMPFIWNTNVGNLPSQYFRIKVGPPLP